MATKELITYARDGEWTQYTLAERPDGTWLYEGHCQIQGCRTGRKVILRAPEGLKILDEADMDTLYTDVMTKSEYLKEMGTEIRCLRRGYLVR